MNAGNLHRFVTLSRDDIAEDLRGAAIDLGKIAGVLEVAADHPESTDYGDLAQMVAAWIRAVAGEVDTARNQLDS
jgi:hypothetical protein